MCWNRRMALARLVSGGNFALSAAKALQENTALTPSDIIKKSLTIAGELCIYTNLSHTIETLEEAT